MIEVSHGPCLLDNNVFASPCTIQNFSQGLAFVNNLVCGTIDLHRVMDRSTRRTTSRTAPKWPAARSFRAATTATATTCSPRPAARMTVRAWPRSMPMPGTRPRSTGTSAASTRPWPKACRAAGDPYPVQPVVRGRQCLLRRAGHPIRNPMRFIPRNRSRSRSKRPRRGVVVTVDVPAAVAARRESVVRTADLGTPRHRRGACTRTRMVRRSRSNADITGERRDGPSVPGPFVALHAGVNRFVCARRTV